MIFTYLVTQQREYLAKLSYQTHGVSELTSIMCLTRSFTQIPMQMFGWSLEPQPDGDFQPDTIFS